MKALSWLFFYGYVGVLVVFGALGVFTARIDHRVLFKFDPASVGALTGASIVSQYRFLRAIEAGFGLFAWVYRREIFSETKFNRIFLAAMFLGVLARLVSLTVDGTPYPVFNFFLWYELIGGGIMLVYTRKVTFAS